MRTLPLTLAFVLAACHQAGPAPSPSPSTAASSEAPAPTIPEENRPYSGIAESETLHLTGTEPFWGGTATAAKVHYTTPETPDGIDISVERFAGRGGLSFNGELESKPFVLMVTPGKCSDGMSDRTYPFTLTLAVRGEQRRGCAWSDAQPFTGPPEGKAEATPEATARP
jgi:uncharacterized membrane protein